jgi:MFS family permease
MLTSVATMMASAALLAAWKSLAGLLIGRLFTGFAVGLVAGTAFTYLIELRLRQGANANVARPRNIGTAINVGALGIGPLVAGCLAEWVRKPLVLPYLLWIALGGLAFVALTSASETGKRAQDASPAKRPRVWVSLPAATATLAAFSANGLFAGLSGLFLATTLHNHSHALAGTTLFIVFSAGVASQLATAPLRASLVLTLGGISMLVGLALLVTSVRLSSPSLALFLISGGLIGAGSGAVFKGTTGIVLEAAAPENRLAMTAQLLIALFIGLSIPVIGAGVALDRGASAPNTVLVFAIAVALGVVASGFQLLTSEPKAAKQLA